MSSYAAKGTQTPNSRLQLTANCGTGAFGPVQHSEGDLSCELRPSSFEV